MSADVFSILAAALAGYGIGSIPFGLLLTRLAGLGDIRKIGSGNIGATNVLRTGNKPLAAAVLVLDAGKGAAVTLAVGAVDNSLTLITGAAAILGHCFPIWLKFKGGKGVATTLGVWLAAAWPVGLAACATWLAMAALFRYSSLAALMALAAAPVIGYVTAGPALLIFGIVIAALVYWRHHANIARLLAGTEPKIGNQQS